MWSFDWNPSAFVWYKLLVSSKVLMLCLFSLKLIFSEILNIVLVTFKYSKYFQNRLDNNEKD